MIGFVIALAMLGPPEETIPIRITGREMIGLQDREDVIRGTCDGRPASATITRSARGGAPRLVLRGGGRTGEVPPSFLGGRLAADAFHFLGLGCDGRRLQLHGLALRADSRGELVMDVQNAILDMRTGAVTIRELHTYSPAETRSELDLAPEAPRE